MGIDALKKSHGQLIRNTNHIKENKFVNGKRMI